MVNGETTYKVIIDGMTRYTIIETNQDDIMVNLYNELLKRFPNVELLNQYINDLDGSQHVSWLVLRAKNYIANGTLYNSHHVMLS